VNVHGPSFVVFEGVQVALSLHEHVFKFPLRMSDRFSGALGEVPIVHHVSKVVKRQVRHLTLVAIVEM